MKKYRLSFNSWCLLLLLVIMIPNFIWFIVPAPNDILRANSTTEFLDIIASVCQVLMIITLCFLKNATASPIHFSGWIIATVFSCLLYFISWITYYTGSTNSLVILGLTIPPCLTFFFFAIDRKNWLALIPILIFSICHITCGIINFMPK